MSVKSSGGMSNSHHGSRRMPDGHDGGEGQGPGGAGQAGTGLGGGGPGRPSGKGKSSWAEMLSSTLPTCWKKNVLEVILEKDERGPFISAIVIVLE